MCSRNMSVHVCGAFRMPKVNKDARSGWLMDLEAVAATRNIESEERSFCVEVVCFGDAASVA